MANVNAPGNNDAFGTEDRGISSKIFDEFIFRTGLDVIDQEQLLNWLRENRFRRVDDVLRIIQDCKDFKSWKEIMSESKGGNLTALCDLGVFSALKRVAKQDYDDSLIPCTARNATQVVPADKVSFQSNLPVVNVSVSVSEVKEEDEKENPIVVKHVTTEPLWSEETAKFLQQVSTFMAGRKQTNNISNVKDMCARVLAYCDLTSSDLHKGKFVSGQEKVKKAKVLQFMVKHKEFIPFFDPPENGNAGVLMKDDLILYENVKDYLKSIDMPESLMDVINFMYEDPTLSRYVLVKKRLASS